MIYELEDRIFFDGAASADIIETESELFSAENHAESNEPAVEQQESENTYEESEVNSDNDSYDSSADTDISEQFPEYNNDSTENCALDNIENILDNIVIPDNYQPEPNALIISSNHFNFDKIVSGANNNTIVITYEQGESVEEVLDALKSKLDRMKAVNIGIIEDSELLSENNTDLYNSLKELQTIDGAIDVISDTDLGFVSKISDFTDNNYTDFQDFDLPLSEFFDINPDGSLDTGNEVIFINSSVADTDEILDDLNQNAEIVLLDKDSDGMQQITDYITEHSGIDTIRIISHGNEGYFTLNGVIIDNNYIEGHSELLASWQPHLSEGADIMIYGCNFAAGSEGRMLTETIADLTGADVAASTETIGGLEDNLNSDWSLNYSAGLITALDLEIDNYDHYLAAQTITVTNNGGSASIPDTLPYIAANLDSLIDPATDELLINFNLSAGNETIGAENQIVFDFDTFFTSFTIDGSNVNGSGTQVTVRDKGIHYVPRASEVSYIKNITISSTRNTSGLIVDIDNTILENVRFYGNRLTRNPNIGAAILAHRDTLIKNCYFIGNGGGGDYRNYACIYSSEYASITFSGTNIFENNDNYGGVIYSEATLIIEENAVLKFTENYPLKNADLPNVTTTTAYTIEYNAPEDGDTQEISDAHGNYYNLTLSGGEKSSPGIEAYNNLTINSGVTFFGVNSFLSRGTANIYTPLGYGYYGPITEIIVANGITTLGASIYSSDRINLSGGIKLVDNGSDITLKLDASASLSTSIGNITENSSAVNLIIDTQNNIDTQLSGSINIDGILTINSGNFVTNGNSITTGGLVVNTDSFNSGSSDGSWNINGDVNIAGGTLTATNGTFNVGGTWTGTGAFTARSSTVNFNGTAQTIGSEDFYNLTTSGNGTKSLVGAVNVSHNLIVGSSAPISGNNSLSVSGTSSIGANISTSGTQYYGELVTLTSNGTTTTFSTSNNSITFGGGITDSSNSVGLTLNAGSGQVSIYSAIDIDGLFTKSGSGNFLSDGYGITAGGLTVNAGNFNSGSHNGAWNINGDVNIAGGTLTATNGTFNVGGTWTGTGAFATRNSTVDFCGASQSIGAETFYNLSTSGSGTKSLSGSVSVNNILTLNNILSVGGNTLTVTGLADINNVINITSGTLNFNGAFDGNDGSISFGISGNGSLNFGSTVSNFTSFTAGNSTVNYSGSSQNISTVAYYNLTTSGSGTKTLLGTTNVSNNLILNAAISVAANTLTVSGAADVNATVSAASGTINFNGDFDGNGGSISFGTSGSGNLNFGGSVSNLTSFTAGNSTVNYNCNGTQDIGGVTYYNLTTSTGGIKTLTGNITVESTLNTATGTTLALSTHTLTLGSSNSAATGSWTKNSAAFNEDSGTFIYCDTADQDIIAETYFNLTTSGSGTKTLLGTTNVTHNLEVSASTSVAANTLTVSGAADVNATVSAASGTINFNGDFDGNGGSISFGTSGSGNLNFGGSVSNLTSFTAGNSTVNYNCNGTQDIGGVTYYNLTTSTGGIKTLTGNITVESTLNTATGTTLALSTHTLTLGSSNSAATGSWTKNSAAFNEDSGTFIYCDTADQDIIAETYFNLTTSGSGTKTLLGTTNVTHNLEVSASTSVAANTLTVSGAADVNATVSAASGTINFNGDFDGNGGSISFGTSGSGNLNFGGSVSNLTSFTAGNSTVNYNCNGTQDIGGVTYYNLTTSTGGIKTLTGNITVESTLNTATGTTLALSTHTLTLGSSNSAATGSWTKNSAAFNEDSGTFIYCDTADQDIIAETYYNLTTSGSGTKTLQGSLNVLNNFTIGSNVVFNVNDSSNLISIGGDWINNGGDFQHNDCTVALNGGNTQNISAETFYNLNVSGSDVVFNNTILIENNIDISGSLTATDQAISISHNWNNSGVFSGDNSTVSFNNAALISEITGSTDFYNFTCTTAGKTLELDSDIGSLQRIENWFTISGNSTDKVILTSTSGSSAAEIEATKSNVVYADVAYSNNTGNTIYTKGSDNGGNNSGWEFSGSDQYVWIGADSVEWSTTSNWLDGYVPDNDQIVIITAGDYALNVDDIKSASNLTIENDGAVVVNQQLAVSDMFTVGGTLTISSGTVTANGDFDAVNGNIICAYTASLNLNSTVYGLGNFTAGESTVYYSSLDNQNIDSVIYYNLTTGGGGTKTLAGNTIVENDFETESDAEFNFSSKTFTLGTSNSGIGTWIMNSGNLGIGTSTFIYGDSEDQSVVAADYYNLTVTGGGITTLQGNVTVNKDLIIEDTLSVENNSVFINNDCTVTGTLSVDSGIVDIDGNFNTNAGNTIYTGTGYLYLAGDVEGMTNFTAGQSTVVYDGASQNVDSGTYYNLLISGSDTKTLIGNITVENNFTLNENINLYINNYTLNINNVADIDGNVFITSGTLDLDGSSDFTNSSLSFNGTGELYLGGTLTGLENFTASNSTVYYDSSSSQNIADVSYCNLLFRESGQKNLSGNIEVTNIFTTENGTVLNAGNSTLIIENIWNHNASSTFNAQTGTVEYNGLNQTFVNVSYNNLTASGLGTATLDGTVNGIFDIAESTLILAGSLVYGNSSTVSYSSTRTSTNIEFPTSGVVNLTVRNNSTLTLEANKTITGNLYIETGSTLIVLNKSFNVAGNWNCEGEYIGTGSTIVLSSGTISGNTEFYSLEIAPGATVTVDGTVSILEDFSLSDSSALNLDPSANITVDNNITVSNSGELNIGDGSLTVLGNITNTSGSVTAENGTLTLDGTVDLGVFDPGTGTVVYTGGNGQVIDDVNYYNLIISGDGSHVAGGNFTVLNDLTLNSTSAFDVGDNSVSVTGNALVDGTLSIDDGSLTVSGEFDADSTTSVVTFGSSGTGTLTLSGNVTGLGDFTAGQSTVIYNGSDQDIISDNYNNLVVQGNGVKNILNGTVCNNLDVTEGATLSADGTISVLENLNITDSSALNLDPSANITVDNNITVSNSGELNIGDGSLTVLGNITNTSGSVTAENGTLTLDGTVDLGVFDPGTGTVVYTGGNGQVIDDVNYYNLIISGNGSHVTGGNFTVLNDLTLNSTSAFDVGNNSVSVTGNAHVDGTLSIDDGSLSVSDEFDADSTTSAVTFGSSGTGTLTLSGNVTGLGDFTAGQSTVIYNKVNQSIIAADYWDLETMGGGINNLEGDVNVNNDLTLTNGIIECNSHDLSVKGNIVAGNSFAASNMIATSGNGNVIQYTPVTGNYLIPVGTNNSMAEYSPVVIDVNGESLTGNSKITVNVTNTKAPGVGNKAIYISRYWDLEMTGINNFSGNITCSYLPGDIVGESSVLYNQVLNGDTWSMFGKMGGTLVFNGISSLGVFTAFCPGIFPDIVNLMNDGTQYQTDTSWTDIIDSGSNNSIDEEDFFPSIDIEGIASVVSFSTSIEGYLNGEYGITDNSSSLSLPDGEYSISMPLSSNLIDGEYSIENEYSADEADEYDEMLTINFDMDNNLINYEGIAALESKHPTFKTEMDLILEKI